MKRSGARFLAIGIVALSLLGSLSAVRTSAAPALKTYTDRSLHVSFKYPATWSLEKATIHARTRSMGITAGVDAVAPDALVGFALAVKPSTTTMAVMKTDIAALLNNAVTVKGKINISTKTSGGFPRISATAKGQFDASHTATLIAVATTNGKATYFIVNYIMATPAASKAEVNQVVAMDDSLTDI